MSQKGMSPIEDVQHPEDESQVLCQCYNFQSRAGMGMMLYHQAEIEKDEALFKKFKVPKDQFLFKINGWTKPPMQMKIGDYIKGIMGVAENAEIVSIEYTDHPGHFGSAAMVPDGAPYVKRTAILDEKQQPVLDEKGVAKFKEEIIEPMRRVYVNDNPGDAKNSRFLLYCVGKRFVPKPPEDKSKKEEKAPKEAKPKGQSKFVEPGDLPDNAVEVE